MKPCLSLSFGVALLVTSLCAHAVPFIATDTLVVNTSDSIFLVHSGDTVSSGHKQIKYANGQLSAEGSLQYWSRQGRWTIYRQDGTKASEVDFVDGKGTHMRAFDEKGQAAGEFIAVEQEATFPGGDAAWNNYMRAALMDKVDYLSRKKAWGDGEVQFVVDIDGSLSNISLAKSSGTVLDKVVLDIIRKSPPWKPAIQYNRPVKAFRRQKFSLQAPN